MFNEKVYFWHNLKRRRHFSIQYVFFGETRLFFPFYYGVSDLITILIGWVTMIWIGTNGNKYLEKQLLESGYRYFKTISAKNHESALLLSDNIS